MTSTPTTASAAALRAITLRLNNTPLDELSRIASRLAAGLQDCGEVLSQNVAAGKERSETGILVHKLKTRLSSLLHDRKLEGRWTAVILIKTVIELGGWETLRGSESWVRGLINIVAKPHPPTIRRLSLLTLTRIFSLTHPFPNLVREITTPLLPSFITTCLKLISTQKSGDSAFVDTVLPIFHFLIPDHPTLFRPFASQIQGLLLPLIAPTTCNVPNVGIKISDVDTARAQELLVSLHHCAPKNTSSEEWGSALRTTIASIHHTSDRVFRSVKEEWESSDPALRQQASELPYSGDVISDGGKDPLGMPSWEGIHNGVERLVGTLQLLSQFITQPTNSTVSLPVGAIIDVTNRINSVIGYDVRSNPEITREEREALFTSLPSIHLATLQILLALLGRLQHGALPIAYNILEQVQWIFKAESYNKDIRTTTYIIFSRLLPLLGPSLPRKSVDSLHFLIRTCCDDILVLNGVLNPNIEPTLSTQQSATQKSQQTTNVDAYLTTPSTTKVSTLTPQTSFPNLLHSASTLLPLFLTYLPPAYLAPALRADIDRTAIILSHKQTMLASVLNPPLPKPGSGTAPASILPFLARAFPGDVEVEALLRPRMPVIFTGRRVSDLNDGAEDDTEDEDSKMDAYADRDQGLGTSMEKMREMREELDQQRYQRDPTPEPEAQPDPKPSLEYHGLLGPLSVSLDTPSAPSTTTITTTTSVPQKRPVSTLTPENALPAAQLPIPTPKKPRLATPPYQQQPARPTASFRSMMDEVAGHDQDNPRLDPEGESSGVGYTGIEGGDVSLERPEADVLATARLKDLRDDEEGNGNGDGDEAEDESESGDEIPALNIEEDTDEDEDGDEDVVGDD